MQRVATAPPCSLPRLYSARAVRMPEGPGPSAALRPRHRQQGRSALSRAQLDYVAAFVGGGLGAALRFAASKAGGRLGWSVWMTLLINLLGCCMLGIFTATLTAQSRLKVLLGTGLCGGLTTFSTFAVEAVQLAKKGLYAKALRYIALSNFGGLAAAAAALSIWGA
mmetsp:Transcript_56381/g.125870  ORF Transcript_56381/g.125870 Transcript_56381/m.125870 type:complete len:166 (+) Transcript_56381:31-528(+)